VSQAERKLEVSNLTREFPKYFGFQGIKVMFQDSHHERMLTIRWKTKRVGNIPRHDLTNTIAEFLNY